MILNLVCLIAFLPSGAIGAKRMPQLPPRMGRLSHSTTFRNLRSSTTSLRILQLDGIDSSPPKPKHQELSLFIENQEKTNQGAIIDSTDDELPDENFFAANLKQIITPFQSDCKSRNKRLMNERVYSKNKLFQERYLDMQPTLKDLSPPQSLSRDTFWMSLPAMISSFAIPCLAFPYLIRWLEDFVTVDANTLGEIASKFGPGVAILYGTFVSITLSLLYQRQEDIQDLAAKESSQLATTTRNLMTLFKEENELAIKAGQCIADQIRTFSSTSRGEELLLIMSDDPYLRIMGLVEELEDKWIDPVPGETLRMRPDLLNGVRESVEKLVKLRASRLSHEALSLPPTHFFILTSLTFLILLGYSIHILPSVTFNAAGAAVPSPESCFLFGLLSAVYVLFYNSACDLNEPFGGIYQIRRSTTACHFLEAKQFIMNHPLLKGNIHYYD